MTPAQSLSLSTARALKRAEPVDRQRAILAVLAARRAVVARETARLERRARRRDEAGESAAHLEMEVAVLAARHAELDRTVKDLAAALRRLGNPAGAHGVSTDGRGPAAT